MNGLFMKFSIARELLAFLWEVRLWWMIPLVGTLLLLSGVIIFAHTSAIAPFIYTLF